MVSVFVSGNHRTLNPKLVMTLGLEEKASKPGGVWRENYHSILAFNLGAWARALLFRVQSLGIQGVEIWGFAFRDSGFWDSAPWLL